MADERIEAVITAKDLASKVIKNFSLGIIAANQAVELLNKGLTALAAPFKAIVSEGAEFEAQMSRIKSISNITAESFSQLTAESKRIGETTQFTATQAAQGMEELTRAGFDAAKTIEIAADAMDLAAAQGSDLADTSRLVGLGFKLFADQGLSAGDIVNDFSKSVGSSAQNMENFIEAFKFAGGQAAAFNQPLSEVTKTIALLADVGFKGTLGGVALRTAISRLAKPTNEASTALDDIGLSLKDVNPETNKFTDILKKLNKAGISNAQVLTLFGQEAGGKFIKVIQDINTLLPEYEKKLGNAKTAQQSAADALDNFKGDVTLFSSALSGVQTSLFDIFKDSLRGATQAATQLVKVFGQFVKANETGISDIFDAIGKSIKNFIKFTKNSISVIGDVVKGIKQFFALKTVDSVLKTIGNTFTNVIGKIIDFGKNIFTTITSNKVFVDGLTSVIGAFDSIAIIISTVINNFLELISSAIEPATNIFGALLEQISKIIKSVESFFLPIWDSVQSAFRDIITVVEPVIQRIIDFAATLADAVASNEDLQIAINDIIDVVKLLFESVSPVISVLIDLAKLAIGPLIDILGILLKGIVKILKGGFLGLKDVIISLQPLFNDLVKWVSEVIDIFQNWLDNILKPVNDFIDNKLVKTITDLWQGFKDVAGLDNKVVNSQKKIGKAFADADEEASKLDFTLTGNTLTVSLAETADKFEGVLRPAASFKVAMDIANKSATNLDTSLKDFNSSGLTKFADDIVREFSRVTDTLKSIPDVFAKVFSGFSDKFKAIPDGIAKAFSGFNNKVRFEFQQIGETISGVFGGNKGPVFGVDNNTLLNIKPIPIESINSIEKLGDHFGEVRKESDPFLKTMGQINKLIFPDAMSSQLIETKEGFVLLSRSTDIVKESFNELKSVTNETEKTIEKLQKTAVEGVQVVVDIKKPTGKDFDLEGIGDISLKNILGFDISEITGAISGAFSGFTDSISDFFGFDDSTKEKTEKKEDKEDEGVSGIAIGLGMQLVSFLGDLISQTKSMQEVIQIISEPLVEILEPIGRALIPFAKLLAKIIRKLAPTIEKVAQFITKIFNRLSPIIERFMDRLIPIIDRLVESLLPVLEAMLDIIIPLLDELLPFIAEILEAIMPLIEELMPIMATFLSIIADILTTLMPGFKILLLTILAPILLIVAIIKLIAPTIKFIGDLISRVSLFLQNGFNALMNIFRPIKSALDTIKSLIKKVTDAIKSITGGGGGLLGGITGGISSFLGGKEGGKNILGFQQGSPGLTADQLVRLPGMESGSGLIKAHVGEQVIPDGGQGGGTVNHFNFNIKAIDPMNQKEEIRQVLESLFLERKLGVS